MSRDALASLDSEEVKDCDVEALLLPECVREDDVVVDWVEVSEGLVEKETETENIKDSEG